MTRREQALRYLQQGMSLVPCSRSREKKEPYIKWTQYQRKMPTAEEVTKWFESFPDCNIGIITGRLSGVVVIDCDSEKALYAVLGKYRLALDNLVSVTTGGGGKHLYFNCPYETVVPTLAGWMLGVDVRGEGGYVVAPPSVHFNGNIYVWDNGEEFADTMRFPDLPHEMLYDLVHHAEKVEIKNFGDEIMESTRDQTLTSYAGTLVKSGLSLDNLIAVLDSINRTRCNPPLELSQVEKIARSIHSRESSKQPKARTERNDFKVTGFDEFVNKHGDTATSWTIDQWLPEATCGMIVALPEMFKSWLTMDLAVAVSTGRMFLDTYPVNSVGRVLVIQQEDPPHEIVKRMALTIGTGPSIFTESLVEIPILPESIPIDFHVAKDFKFYNHEMMQSFEKVVEENQYKLVIIDPLYSAAKVDDYMAQTAQDMLFLKHLRDRTGCSFMIVHHRGRSLRQGGRERDHGWGSQFINAWIETGWDLAPGESQSQVIVHRHFKTESAPPIVRINFDIGDWETNHMPSETSVSVDAILNAVRMGKCRTYDDMIRISGCKSKATVVKVCKKFRVTKDSETGYYTLPPDSQYSL